ncbi:hypothetical protein BH09CHL1_BH09CHL1_09670 [soil metagenome]
MIEVAIFRRTTFFARLIVIATIVHMPARLIVLRSLAIVGALFLARFERSILARWSWSLVPVEPAIVGTLWHIATIIAWRSLAIIAIEAALIRAILPVSTRPRRRTTRSFIPLRRALAIIALRWTLPIVTIESLTIAWRTGSLIPLRRSLAIVTIESLTIARRSRALIALWRSLTVVAIESLTIARRSRALIALRRPLAIVALKPLTIPRRSRTFIALRRSLPIVTIESLTIAWRSRALIALWRSLTVVAIESPLFARFSIGRRRRRSARLCFLVLIWIEIALRIEATLSSLFLLWRLPVTTRWLR